MNITYYQGALGKPYAISGNTIAYLFGWFDVKRIFKTALINDWEKNKFPISELRQINYGMPSHLKDGLDKALELKERIEHLESEHK